MRFHVLKLLCAAAATLGFLSAKSDAAAAINPPFELHWGETAERMERLLSGAHAKIVLRHMVGGQEAWDVEGLTQPALRRTVFFFVKSELVGVELQYQKEDWDESKYDRFMGDLRRWFEQRHGVGELIARKTDAESAAAVTQNVTGYKWNQNNTAIELVYFSATSGTQVFRTISVHYKTY